MNASRQAIVIGFLAGCIAGVIGGAMYQRRMFRHVAEQGPDTGRALDKLNRELSLNAAQQEAVKAALEKRRVEMEALHKETMARMEQIRHALRAEIEPLLSSEQKAKFADMKARWERRHLHGTPEP